MSKLFELQRLRERQRVEYLNAAARSADIWREPESKLERLREIRRQEVARARTAAPGPTPEDNAVMALSLGELLKAAFAAGANLAVDGTDLLVWYERRCPGPICHAIARRKDEIVTALRVLRYQPGGTA
jgi:hypothetical protein